MIILDTISSVLIDLIIHLHDGLISVQLPHPRGGGGKSLNGREKNSDKEKLTMRAEVSSIFLMIKEDRRHLCSQGKKS